VTGRGYWPLSLTPQEMKKGPKNGRVRQVCDLAAMKGGVNYTGSSVSGQREDNYSVYSDTASG